MNLWCLYLEMSIQRILFYLFEIFKWILRPRERLIRKKRLSIFVHLSVGKRYVSLIYCIPTRKYGHPPKDVDYLLNDLAWYFPLWIRFQNKSVQWAAVWKNVQLKVEALCGALNWFGWLFIYPPFQEQPFYWTKWSFIKQYAKYLV